jgi:hypothetical protein
MPLWQCRSHRKSRKATIHEQVSGNKHLCALCAPTSMGFTLSPALNVFLFSANLSLLCVSALSFGPSAAVPQVPQLKPKPATRV